MSGPRVIDSYLAELAALLPAEIVTELADGLREGYDVHRGRGLSDPAAAAAAVAEFGEAATVAAAFDAVSPARRWARMMLSAGPLVGGAWAAVLLTRHASDWPVPAEARVGFGLAILTSVLLLAAAAFSAGYRRSGRSAIAAGLIVFAVDTAMLGYVASAGILTSWPVLLAAALSTTRIGFTLTRSAQLLACC